MKRNLLVVAAGLLAVAVFLLGAFFYAGKKDEQTVNLAQTNRDALVRPHSPIYRSPSAKVTIVEFLDPACETCRAFYPFVKSMVNASFGQVNLVVRYAPLHHGSDEAVKILEAARMQNLYWQVMEAMFAAQPIWASHEAPRPALIWEHIKGTGLDIAKAKADMNDPSIAKILLQDGADVESLRVTKTPGFFVNGKPLVDFGSNQLKALVDQEVRTAYGK